jgi:hypothetical protein
VIGLEESKKNCYAVDAGQSDDMGANWSWKWSYFICPQNYSRMKNQAAGDGAKVLAQSQSGVLQASDDDGG